MAITIESIVVVVVLLLGLLFQLLATGPNQGFSVKIRAEYPYSKFNENAVVNLKVERAYDNIQGPESIILDPFRNDIYVGIENGTVLKISPDGTRELFVQTPGRPLGGAVDNDGIGIYLCVPPFGLLYVRFEDRLIRLASSISDDRIPIRFIDDAAVASDGKVYFTDASRVAPVLNEDGRYDVLHASKVDSLAGSGTGRLLCFDPETGTTKTLLSRLMFANGVAISEDHSFVVVAESFAFHLRRYYINGPKAGTSDVFASALPGMPDGIDAAPGGGFNVAIVSEVYNKL